MELITRKSLAAKALSRWNAQYGERPDASQTSFIGNWRAIAIGLESLGEAPDPDEVDRVIGNGSWTECRCDECRKAVDAVVLVGEEPNYESATAMLCRDCAVQAARIFMP